MITRLCTWFLSFVILSSGGGDIHRAYSQENQGGDLSALRAYVMKQGGTEPAFANQYWNEKREGIYVDAMSGEPLFSSQDKFDSGTGWPSFTKPLEGASLLFKEDRSLIDTRTEVRAGDSHLGHVFNDGPTGKRFCINSAALRFIPRADMEREGYGHLSKLFGEKVEKAKNGEKKMSDTTKVEIATLAGGCFWGVEELIRKLPGVITTEVGYTGGSVAAPSYDQVSTGKTGHAESVQIQFDPNKITYKEILLYFFKLHDPTSLNRQGNDIGTQYRSAIFTHNASQREVAEKVIDEVNASGKWKKPVVTEIVDAGEWTTAEAYHQDYLQHRPDGYTCHYLRE
jgi:peptide methionine sulfoxide reductase msrA/msrB